jgi:hypothetical protein
MKINLTKHMKSLFAGLLLAGTALSPVAAQAQQIIHTVTGSGLTVVPFGPDGPFSFRQSISAWQKSDGTFGGSAVVQIWFPGAPDVVMVMEITSLTVVGNTAYYTTVTTHSNSDNEYFKVGTLGKGFITDSNGNGPDHAYSGPIFIPFLPDAPVAQGNFVVR